MENSSNKNSNGGSGGGGSSLGYSYYMPKGGIYHWFKSILTFNCCNIFGVFNKHLAPAHNHDRCERSVQMKLYTMNKREVVLVFLGFFLALGIVSFIGLVGPPITYSSEQRASSLPNASSLMATGPFVLKSQKLNTYFQQLWLIAQIEVENKDEIESFEKSFDVIVHIYGLDSGSTYKIYREPAKRSRLLKCRGGCEPFTILHLTFIDFSRYYVGVEFEGLESVHQKYNIKDIIFYFKSYNPSFTQLELSFRFIYALSSFIITAWFLHTLRKHSWSNWSIEQKWISILIPLLFLYNNPAFPLMFLINSNFPSILDSIFQISFLAGLFLFWLSVYHAIREVDRRFLTFYLPKVIVVGSLWISALILTSWQKISSSKDPTYNYTVDTEKYNNLKNFFIIFGIIYLVYLSYLVIKAYSELRSMPFFDMRLKFLTGLMTVVMKISMIITYLRFGGVDILEDHFVMDLSTKYSSSIEFMGFYGLLNFYVFIMAFVYSPSSSAILNTSITRDNPSFSMINDSDEDIIYDHEDEDQASTPLTNGVNSMNSTHGDDSD